MASVLNDGAKTVMRRPVHPSIKFTAFVRVRIHRKVTIH